MRLLDQLVWRHARAPLAARLELDGGLEHLERRWIGGGIGASGFAEDARHLRHGLDQAVGLLQQLGRLAGRDAGQRRGHIQQIAFIERRHELAAEPHRRIGAHQKDDQRDEQRHLWECKHPAKQRPVNADQGAIERVAALGGNLAADQISHQHGNQRYGQSGGGRHGIGLGVGQRREQAAFLRFERKHRDERKGDDQERSEQRRPDLRRGVADHAPLRIAGEALVGMRVLPRLDVLVRVLDHHHGRVHHRADRDRDAAERHDVGIDALVVHDDEGSEHAEGQ